MVGKWEVSDIGLHGGVTNGVDKVKLIKIISKFQTKKCQNTVVHTSTLKYAEPIILFSGISLFPCRDFLHPSTKSHLFNFYP